MMLTVKRRAPTRSIGGQSWIAARRPAAPSSQSHEAIREPDVIMLDHARARPSAFASS
jgi:hypothetical protein